MLKPFNMDKKILKLLHTNMNRRKSNHYINLNCKTEIFITGTSFCNLHLFSKLQYMNSLATSYFNRNNACHFDIIFYKIIR